MDIRPYPLHEYPRKKEEGRRKNIVLSEYAASEQDARTTEI
ncbi:hypothetical protein [Okeania sp. SIO2B3]|nr:hypothetical protein [Okeania sp. SIO2B3]